jgi:hypothetical protein
MNTAALVSIPKFPIMSLIIIISFDRLSTVARFYTISEPYSYKHLSNG